MTKFQITPDIVCPRKVRKAFIGTGRTWADIGFDYDIIRTQEPDFMY